MPWLTVTASVGGANALCGAHAVGYPGMPAFNGMASVVARNVGRMSGGDGLVRGLAVLHHSGRLRARGRYGTRLTHKRAVHDSSERSPRDHFATPMAVQPQVDLAFTLGVETDLPPAFIAACEEAARGGGRSPAMDAVPVRSLGGRVEPTAVGFGGALDDAMRKAPPGWLLCDHTDELDGHGGVVEAMVARTFGRGAAGKRAVAALDPTAASDPETVAEAVRKARDAAGRVPMHVGWISVSEGRPRRGARDPGATHHYVESVTGLASFTRRHEALRNEPWRAHWVPSIDGDLFTLGASRP